MNAVYIFTIFVISCGNTTDIDTLPPYLPCPFSPQLNPPVTLPTTKLTAAVLQTYYPKIYKNHVRL